MVNTEKSQRWIGFSLRWCLAKIFSRSDGGEATGSLAGCPIRKSGSGNTGRAVVTWPKLLCSKIFFKYSILANGGNMSYDRSNKLIWFLAGLGVGSVTALLYAPKSGRATRQALATQVEDGREYLASLGRNARDQVSGWVDTGKRVVTNKKDQVESAIHDAAAAVANRT